jgi:hypothetical protein
MINWTGENGKYALFSGEPSVLQKGLFEIAP